MTETTQIPIAVLAEFLRHQADVDSDVTIHPYTVADQVDEWDVIQEAEFKDGEWAHGDAHMWFETEVRLERKVRRARRLEPAEYETEYVAAHVSMQWDLDHANPVNVDIEVDV